MEVYCDKTSAGILTMNCWSPLHITNIVFSSKLSWSKALETLASQAAKATYMIRFINRECNHLPVSLQFDLFDTK